jgi:hypothetical protein
VCRVRFITLSRLAVGVSSGFCLPNHVLVVLGRSKAVVRCFVSGQSLLGGTRAGYPPPHGGGVYWEVTQTRIRRGGMRGLITEGMLP